jgi:hypothetical protein
MASTIQLQNTLDWSGSFLKFPQLTIGRGGEPTYTSANLIMQTILGPPFAWPWNRFKASFLISQGIQDTITTNITNVGYFEVASIQPAASVTNTALTSNVATYTAANKFVAGNVVTVTGTTNGGGTFNVTNQPILSSPAPTASQFSVAITHANIASAGDTGLAVSGSAFSVQLKNEALTEAYGAEQDRPQYLSWQVDNDASTIIFRTLPVADQTYNVILTYQGAPPLFTTLTQTLNPIPDYMAGIFQYGFLSFMFDFWDDEQRANRYRQLFVATLLARQTGLDQEDRAIWLGTWYPELTQQLAREARANMGERSRAV